MKSCQIQVTKKEKEEETHQAFFFFFFFFINPLGHYYYFIHTYILFLYFCHKLWFLLVFQQEDSRNQKKKKGKFILVCLKTLWNLLQWVALDLLRPKPMVILKLLLFLSGFSGICSKFWYYLKRNVSECYCKK